MNPSSVRRKALASLAVGTAVACSAAGTAAAQELDVVAEGLSNPRGMTFGPDGRLYVAESGRGGDGACVGSPEEEGEQCYGATGAISRVNVNNGRRRALIAGLPSVAPQEGEEAGSGATGPQDVSFRGGRAYFVTGLGGNLQTRAQLGRAGKRFGVLWTLSKRGKLAKVVDLARYEARKNPDGGEIDSNPYSVDAHGRRLFVTDAGGNDLLSVGRRGGVATLAVFPGGEAPAPPGIPDLPPTIPYQAVPTGVVRGPDNAAYVGSLTGFPFPVGGANVFRVQGGAAPTVLAGGFTNIVDVARDQAGNLYVLQITSTGLAGPPSPGKLIRLAPDGSQTELAVGLLQQPTGVAVSSQGGIYVANNGTSGDAAQIVRIAG